MKLKKRRKSYKMRGTRLMGHAAKKHKGSGNRGGCGMGGMGKRSKHRKTYAIRYLFPYFGKQGYTKGLHSKKGKLKAINLETIEKNIQRYNKTKEGIEINAAGYKVLGEGDVKEKLIVRAEEFSKSAREKIEKAGGKAIILREEKKEDKKEKKKSSA